VLAIVVEPDTLENWRLQHRRPPGAAQCPEALLNRDPETNELVGELATSWEQTDDVTWRFKLREGVTFHNGEAFNAEVAAFGINYTWSPENNFQIYQYVGPDMNAKVVDDYTIDVVTEAPDPILPSRLYFSPIPSMKQVQEEPDTLPDNPIGTGPYKFVEWNRGQSILLEANPDGGATSADDAHGAVTYQGRRVRLREESAVRASMVVTARPIRSLPLSRGQRTTPQPLTGRASDDSFLRLDTMHPP